MIGIFGSAFNPPTLGHQDEIEQGLALCSEVWLVPAIAHAFGKVMLPFDIRWALVEAFVHDIGLPRVKASPIEARLWDGQGPVTTLAVLHTLQDEHPGASFVFLCGPDNAEQFDRFVGADEIRRRWGVLTLTERCSIRSTTVRNRCQADQSVTGWVTPRVEAFLRSHELYV